MRRPHAQATAPKDGQPGSPRVALAFAWPHGLSMSVHVTHQRQQGREQARSALTYRVGVAELDDGLRIHYGSYMPYLQVPGALPTKQHGMRERLAALVPDLITDREGGFKELPDLPRSSKRKRLQVIGAKGRQQARAAQAISDDGLTLAARRFWDDRVGRWRAHPGLVQGEQYEEPDAMVVPELDDATVSAMSRYTFVGWTRCNDDAPTAECVEIHMETHPEADAIKQAVKAFQKRLGRHARAVVRNVELRTRVELVTDPATLRPQRYKEDHFTVIALRDSLGNETQDMTTDTQLEVYTY